MQVIRHKAVNRAKIVSFSDWLEKADEDLDKSFVGEESFPPLNTQRKRNPHSVLAVNDGVLYPRGSAGPERGLKPATTCLSNKDSVAHDCDLNNESSGLRRTANRVKLTG